MRRFFITIFASFLIFAPHISHAAVQLFNPLGTVTDPRVIIGNIIKAILSIIGSIALLMFVYAGVLWITSFGEAKKIEQGKKIMIWATFGMAIIAGSYVIVNTIIRALGTGTTSP